LDEKKAHSKPWSRIWAGGLQGPSISRTKPCENTDIRSRQTGKEHALFKETNPKTRSDQQNDLKKIVVNLEPTL